MYNFAAELCSLDFMT